MRHSGASEESAPGRGGREAGSTPSRPAPPGLSDLTGADILAELTAREPADQSDVLARAWRAGVDLRAGAVALAARREPASLDGTDGLFWPAGAPALIGLIGPGHLRALVGLSPGVEDATALAESLRHDGWTVALSAPRRVLRHALREAELLDDLAARGQLPSGQVPTYRLLIGVLLHDPEELETLRAQTVEPLVVYDARHGTELLATLRAFLAHDGSTTETADAMQLHRHTVGYRLVRVHEVSGLSPYETTGRERLSLGLKAGEIIGSATGMAQSQLTL